MLRLAPAILAMLLAAAQALAQSAPASAPAAAAPALSAADYQRIDQSIAAAAAYLKAQIGPDGKASGEFAADNPRHGGRTAACAYALLSAGVRPQDAALARAIKWLSAAKLNGTYAVAMRAAALSLLKDDASLKLLASDVDWLVKAAADDGSYTYTSCDGKRTDTYDNSNAQVAALGVWAGMRRGVSVPQRYWELVQRHWTAQQQGDGGWGYLIPPGSNRGKSYGSMTAAGLATMLLAYDNLNREAFARCVPGGDERAIELALKWLRQNFDATQNPRLGDEWYYYWLFSLERVAMAGGYRRMGGHDWYAQGSMELMRRQGPDGAFGHGDLLGQTVFATMFLVRGRQPLAISKLAYDGKWNARPRDAANLAEWLSYTFERPMGWQVTDFSAEPREWLEAPILYISGAGAVEFTDQQVARLRQYVLMGGTIVSESAGNNAAFTIDMQKTFARMLPQWPAKSLGADHPIYTVHYKQDEIAGLVAIRNGTRMLAVHSPREISLGLQLPAEETYRSSLELAANIFLVATDKAALRPREHDPWPAAAALVEPKATIRLARLRHGGNYEPEPLAFGRLAGAMGELCGIELRVSEPMPITKLDATKWPVASLVGCDGDALTPREVQALHAYLMVGGKLVVEGAGGSKTFVQGVQKQLEGLLDDSRLVVLSPAHAIFKAPLAARKVTYRRDFALSLGDQKNDPQLSAILVDGAPAVIFSDRDISTGLVGAAAHKVAGYSPESATAVMINVLCELSGVQPAQ